jgi:hypothetical protein
MKIEHFLKEYYLHDSVVEKMVYSSSENFLTIHLELCNYLQSNYSEGDLEIIKGTLQFTVIGKLVTNFSFEDLNWSENVDGEILAFNQVNTKSTGLNNVLKMVIQLDDYQKKEKKILTVQFTSDQVSWNPA